MEIRLETSMHAQTTETLSDSVVLSDHHSAVAEGAEVLGREEAERSDRRDFASHTGFAADPALRADGLRGVLDHGNAGQQLLHAFHRRHLPEEIDGNDRLGTR